jgi:hypothetical protein
VAETLPSGLTLAEFIEFLEARLPMSNPAAMQDALRALASHVPPQSRLRALEEVPAAAAPTDPDMVLRDYAPLPVGAPGEELADRVVHFTRRLEEGEYFQALDWDDELGEERAFGDDGWAREMDEMLGQGATAYLAGNHELAARVYGPLLATLRHAERRGVFCGPQPPHLMVQTELNEAKRRHLRSLYRITDTQSRAERLLAQLELTRGIGEVEISLRAILDTEPDGDPALEDVEDFIPRWIAALERVSQDSSAWGRDARRLLREAVEMAHGVEGLAELARAAGGDHPEAYHEWVGSLVRCDRVTEAIAAAKEGVGRIRDSGYRARLADRLAALAAAEEDSALALEGARSAWRSMPTEVRLLNLVSAAESYEEGGCGSAQRVLTSESAMLLRPDWSHSDALACRMLLLVGRIEEATTRFQRADSLGWGRPNHAGSIVLPFLLLASTDEAVPPEGSAIARQWSALDDPGRNYFDRRLLLDRISTGEATTRPVRSYSEMLLEAVAKHRVAPGYRPRTLQVAQLKVEAATRDILNGQHRRGHLLAAELTTAVAEAIALAGNPSDGLDFFQSTRKRFRRYRTFAEALKTARAESPILSGDTTTEP